MHDVRIDMDKLHPLLKYRLKRFLKACEKAELGIIITEGYRTVEYQDRLYAKGRTEKGNIVTNAKGSDYSSQHQWGIAFDIAINDKKHTYDVELIKKAAKLAKKVGLSWGGDWKSFKDIPHFYLGKWGSGTSELKRQYITPDRFMATWKAKVNYDGLRMFKNVSKTKVIMRIPINAEVKVLYKKLWYAKIEYKDEVGYVRKKYIR